MGLGSGQKRQVSHYKSARTMGSVVGSEEIRKTWAEKGKTKIYDPKGHLAWRWWVKHTGTLSLKSSSGAANKPQEPTLLCTVTTQKPLTEEGEPVASI